MCIESAGAFGCRLGDDITDCGTMDLCGEVSGQSVDDITDCGTMDLCGEVSEIAGSVCSLFFAGSTLGLGREWELGGVGD